jgi:hypothetical protein
MSGFWDRSTDLDERAMEAGAIEMRAGGSKAQALGGSGRNEAVEGCHPLGLERIQGTPERVIIEMAGLHAWGDETRERLVVEKWGMR